MCNAISKGLMVTKVKRLDEKKWKDFVNGVKSGINA